MRFATLTAPYPLTRPHLRNGPRNGTRVETRLVRRNIVISSEAGIQPHRKSDFCTRWARMLWFGPCFSFLGS